MWEWYSEHLSFAWVGDRWLFAVSLLHCGLPLAFSMKCGEYWGVTFLCFYVERLLDDKTVELD